MKIKISTLIIFIFLSSLWADGEIHHGHSHGHSHTSCSHCSGKNSTLKHPAIQVLKAFHSALDPEHLHYDSWRAWAKSLFKRTTWKKYLRNLNPIRIAKDSVRVVRMFENSPELKKHAFNLAAVWPLSELTEIFLSPALLAILNNMGLSAWASTAISAPFSITILPGVCPLCGIIFLVYPIKAVERTVTVVRQALIGLPFQFIKGIGNKLIIAPLTRELSVPDYLQSHALNSKHSGVPYWELEGIRSAAISGKFLFRLRSLENHENLLEIELKRNSKNRFYVSNIGVTTHTQRSTLEALHKDRLKFLGWNTRDIICQIVKRIQRGTLQDFERMFYVSNVVIENNWARISFEDHAIHLPNKRYWGFQKPWLGCSNFMATFAQ